MNCSLGNNVQGSGYGLLRLRLPRYFRPRSSPHPRCRPKFDIVSRAKRTHAMRFHRRSTADEGVNKLAGGIQPPAVADTSVGRIQVTLHGFEGVLTFGKERSLHRITNRTNQVHYKWALLASRKMWSRVFHPAPPPQALGKFRVTHIRFTMSTNPYHGGARFTLLLFE